MVFCEDVFTTTEALYIYIYIYIYILSFQPRFLDASAPTTPASQEDTAMKQEDEEEEDEEEEESLPGSTLFIKNLNFSTTEETLQEVSTIVL